MRKKNYKGRCEKVSVSKSKDVCRLYSEIQKKYLRILEENTEIEEIRCNVLLDGLEEGAYTSDFVCTKTGNHLMVREWKEKELFVDWMPATEQELWESTGIYPTKVETARSTTSKYMQNQMTGVGRMNNIRACAEEIVLKEIVYR